MLFRDGIGGSGWSGLSHQCLVLRLVLLAHTRPWRACTALPPTGEHVHKPSQLYLLASSPTAALTPTSLITQKPLGRNCLNFLLPNFVSHIQIPSLPFPWSEWWCHTCRQGQDPQQSSGPLFLLLAQDPCTNPSPQIAHCFPSFFLLASSH